MSVSRHLPRSVLLAFAVLTLLGISMPAQATIDVTLEIAGAPASPEVNQHTPGMLAGTGFDPLPLGATAAFFVAIGILSLKKQTRSQTRGNS